MNRRRLVLSFLLALLVPALASAHGGGGASVIVPADHINPGQVFSLIAVDFGSDSVVRFKITTGDRTVDLGNWTAGPDGHFEANLDLPADFPFGWADLVATGEDGSSTTTHVLVGPISDTTPSRPGRIAPWWQDPSVWLLGAFMVGAALVLVWVVYRSRPRSHPVMAGTRTRVPRKARKR